MPGSGSSREASGSSAREGLPPTGRPFPLPTWWSLCREVGAEELGRFCARVSALLQVEDWGPDALDALRRLFLIVAATKYSRR